MPSDYYQYYGVDGDDGDGGDDAAEADEDDGESESTVSVTVRGPKSFERQLSDAMSGNPLLRALYYGAMFAVFLLPVAALVIAVAAVRKLIWRKKGQ